MTESLALIPSAAESQLNRNSAFRELREMVLNSVVSQHSKRNYAKALDEVFALCEERKQPLSRALRPDVAVVEVLTSVTGIPKMFPGTNTDDKGRLRTRLLQVLVKDGREWKITAYHDTDVKSGVPVPDPQ